MSALFVDEYFFAYAVTPELLDHLLAHGWRHFGVYFYRYSRDHYGGQTRNVLPVRVNLAQFRRSKNQRRVWHKNQEMRCEIRPATVDAERIALFERHKARFTHNIPENIYEFISEEPATMPTLCREVGVFQGDKLLAVSFLDIGAESVSTIYGMFDPDFSAHSLGLYTMLCEIDYAQRLGKSYYYHGYCHDTASFYDYKKRFNGLEKYDWQTESWSKW